MMRQIGNIRTRLAVLVFAMLAGCVAIGVLGVSTLKATVAGLNTVYLDRVVPLRDLKAVSDLYAVSIVDASHKARSGELGMAEAAAMVADSQKRIAAYWRAYLSTQLIPEEQRLVARIEPLMQAAQRPLQALTAALQQEDRQALNSFVSTQLYPVIDPLSSAFSELIDIQLKESQREYEAGTARYERSLMLTIGLVLFVSLAGGALALATVRGITGPLDSLKMSAARIADGDLTENMTVTGRDEVTDVQRSLRQMQTNLRDTLMDIQNSAAQLAAAAEELTTVTAQSARTIEEQDQQVQLAATAVTEMSAAVDEVARNAASTSEASRTAAELTGSSRQQVSETRRTIDQLGEKLSQTGSTVNRLIDETARINHVLEAIHGIAGQTNLLALNAAIEAARAGEAGRGFAVVADEVRSLAQRTQASTGEVEKMLGTIQQAGEEAAQNMQQSSSLAERSQAMAGQADAALDCVSDQVSLINDMNLVIASAAEEQAQVARSVDENLVAIGDLSHQSAASSEQTSAASDALARLAVQLNDRVGQFRL
ncbi:methyl-accepting chemotaxis protein [Stutzerimonas zhaodongensis]|jgi:methyl-accepting chemotaxis protein|uniref:methyl-accepting chemotaxis protein n=1 Tax=Stutzerimonas zhaodongensis TaxID=1176257 RepID=UPI001F4DB9B3|nr:methyl-accepting chemotaxis protein [Stutzerimonas zhaodongensis]UNG18752.1 methyl-accepting chemotaxis protein [Stutzerimonas zhaodongensis]